LANAFPHFLHFLPSLGGSQKDNSIIIFFSKKDTHPAWKKNVYLSLNPSLLYCKVLNCLFLSRIIPAKYKKSMRYSWQSHIRRR
jgi:hypothetical protein